MKNAVGRLLSAALVCLIVASALGSLVVFPWSLDTSSEQSDRDESADGPTPGTLILSYVSHVPIVITSNAIFDSLASSNGWAGNGLTAATPYEIKGYSIVNTVQEIIYISGTTRYFVIKNNLLDAMDGGQDGVFLSSVSHGRIESNVITNCQHGVYLKASSDASVWNNTIQNCTQSGIRVYQTAATISENDIGSAVYNGIWLEGGTGVKVLDNEIHDNTENGVFADGRNEGTDYAANTGHVIEYNTIHDVDNGVFLYTPYMETGQIVTQLNVSHNTFYDTTYSGVYLSGPDVYSCRITNNNISSSDGYGIVLDYETHSNIVSQNRIHGSALGGIYLTLGASANTIDRNTVYDCPLGVWVEGAAHTNTLMFNALYDPDGLTRNGIGFRVDGGCNNIVFINNTVLNSTSYGAYIGTGTEDITVEYNSFLTNNLGGDSQALCDTTLNSLYIKNFWDDWTSPDDNHDGYVDFPYDIDGAADTADPLPLASPWNPVGYHMLTPMTVTYPNGGELINGSATITWTAPVDTEGHPVTYTVQYSNNSGVDWHTIVAGITATSYLWDTSSLAEGPGYWIRVIADCSLFLTVFDTSDASFTVQTHELTPVTVTYPNGGELIIGTVTITWTASVDSVGHTVSYTVLYSDNSGVDWYEIVTDITTTSHLWNTSSLAGGSQYVVRVIGECSDLLSVADTSDAPFTIQSHEFTPPTVTYPNGGELINGSVTITWTASVDSEGHAVSYTILYSDNSGVDWYEIVAGVTATSYLWDTSSLTEGSEYLVRVIAKCSELVTVIDTSNASFTIQAHELTPIMVTDPNGAELINGSVTITWTASMDSYGHVVSYTILYSNNSGVDWYEIVTGITTTSYLWNTSSLAGGSQYLVRVIAECSELLTTFDTSDASFTIRAHELTTPELTYPLASDNVYGTVTIRWQASSDSWGGSITYAAYYSGNGGLNWVEIASGLTVASCSWDTAGLPGGSNYVVKVVASCGHEESIEALSGTFTLVATTTTTTTTSTTTTSTTTGQTGPGMDYGTLLLLAAGAIVAVLVVACVLVRARSGHGGGSP